MREKWMSMSHYDTYIVCFAVYEILHGRIRVMLIL